jgi:hypothetical protein
MTPIIRGIELYFRFGNVCTNESKYTSRRWLQGVFSLVADFHWLVARKIPRIMKPRRFQSAAGWTAPQRLGFEILGERSLAS